MKLKNLLLSVLTASALIGGAMESRAAVSYTVSPSATWVGYMNWFNVPISPAVYPPSVGGFQFASGWGTGDLVAYFTGPVLTLAPNTIGDPNPYWYTPAGGPGSVGNKIGEANMYVELPTDTVNGQLVTFAATVLSDSLTLANNPLNKDANGNGWTSVAFIKDFAPDYSSFNVVTAPIVAGNFSISLAADAGAGRHVQYGFATMGPNVWVTDVAPFGNVQVTAIPEPSTFALAGLSAAALLIFRRRS